MEIEKVKSEIPLENDEENVLVYYFGTNFYEMYRFAINLYKLDNFRLNINDLRRMNILDIALIKKFFYKVSIFLF